MCVLIRCAVRNAISRHPASQANPALATVPVVPPNSNISSGGSGSNRFPAFHKPPAGAAAGVVCRPCSTFNFCTKNYPTWQCLGFVLKN